MAKYKGEICSPLTIKPSGDCEVWNSDLDAGRCFF